MQPQIQFSVAWCSSKCKIFDFVAYLVFSAQRLRFLSYFLAFSCPFLIGFFDSVIEKSTKFVRFVKGKQLACWQVLIKGDRSHLSIYDESKHAHINRHHKCSIDWLCVKRKRRAKAYSFMGKVWSLSGEEIHINHHPTANQNNANFLWKFTQNCWRTQKPYNLKRLTCYIMDRDEV